MIRSRKKIPPHLRRLFSTRSSKNSKKIPSILSHYYATENSSRSEFPQTQHSAEIKNMPKRKLGDTDGPARSSDKAHRKMSMKAVRLGVKFEHGVQMIVRGLKTARGFERQKLSRREKTARSENSENTRMTLLKLAEEIEALKV
jgi:hypothetical protein